MNDEDPDREAILARRRRLVALALSGLTTTAAGCYESHERAGDGGTVMVDTGSSMPCLGAPLEDSGGPMACLGMLPEDAGPTACLDVAPIDAGSPKPCLEAPLEDAGTDAEPGPCLSFARAEADDGEDPA